MRAALCAALALLAAPLAGQEQVRIQVPPAVVFPVTDLHVKTTTTTLLSFDHALLAPGSRLRISVRAEGLDLGTGALARVSYAARAHGGIAFSASLRDTELTPIFESDPLTLAGTVEIAWTLEPPGRFDRAGNHSVTLRWKVEAIPMGSPAYAAGSPATPSQPLQRRWRGKPLRGGPYGDRDTGGGAGQARPPEQAPHTVRDRSAAKGTAAGEEPAAGKNRKEMEGAQLPTGRVLTPVTMLTPRELPHGPAIRGLCGLLYQSASAPRELP
jgi:hypothetical protein